MPHQLPAALTWVRHSDAIGAQDKCFPPLFWVQSLALQLLPTPTAAGKLGTHQAGVAVWVLRPPPRAQPAAGLQLLHDEGWGASAHCTGTNHREPCSLPGARAALPDIISLPLPSIN